MYPREACFPLPLVQTAPTADAVVEESAKSRLRTVEAQSHCAVLRYLSPRTAMGDPRPFSEDKFRRESEKVVVNFLADLDTTCSVTAGQLMFSDPKTHSTLARVFSRLVDTQCSAGEDLEYFRFLLRCTRYPFLANNIVFMHKNDGNERALLAAVLWLVHLLLYERVRGTVSFSEGDTAVTFYRQVKVLYADFLERGVGVRATDSDDSSLLPQTSSTLSCENLVDKNRQLRGIAQTISHNKTRRDYITLRKAELFTKLRTIQRRFQKALEGTEIVQSSMSQLRIAIRQLQFEHLGIVATLSATLHRAGQAYDTSMHLESSRSSRVSSVSELSRSLQQKAKLLSGLSLSLHLPTALAEVFQPRYIRDSMSVESLKLQDELVVSLRRETARAAGAFRSAVEREKVVHGVLERISLERESQCQKLTNLEQLLRRAEDEYQSERHSQDEKLQDETATLREMEKSIQALISEQKLHMTFSVDNMRNIFEDADRSFSSDKAAVQNRLWLVLDLLMSHKQRNHEILDGCCVAA